MAAHSKHQKQEGNAEKIEEETKQVSYLFISTNIYDADADMKKLVL